MQLVDRHVTGRLDREPRHVARGAVERVAQRRPPRAAWAGRRCRAPQPRRERLGLARSATPRRSTTVSVAGGELGRHRLAQRGAPHLRGIALSYLRGVGPNGLPPPFHWVARIEPWRARPVPFCFHGLRPPPETSLRPLVSWVPARRVGQLAAPPPGAASGTRGVPPNTSADSSSVCLDFPLRVEDRHAGHRYLASFAFCCCALVCFTLLRITTRPPMAPGTAPRSRTRFCSGITRATTRLSTVRRSAAHPARQVMARPHPRGIGRGADRARRAGGTSSRGSRRRPTSRSASRRPGSPCPWSRPTTSTNSPGVKSSTVSVWPTWYALDALRLLQPDLAQHPHRASRSRPSCRWPAIGLVTFFFGSARSRAGARRSRGWPWCASRPPCTGPPRPRSPGCGCRPPRRPGSSRLAADQSFFHRHGEFSLSLERLELDLDVDAAREIELHQGVHGLRASGSRMSMQPLVRAHLELLARRLVHVRASAAPSTG